MKYATKKLIVKCNDDELRLVIVSTSNIRGQKAMSRNIKFDAFAIAVIGGFVYNLYFRCVVSSISRSVYILSPCTSSDGKGMRVMK